MLVVVYYIGYSYFDSKYSQFVFGNAEKKNLKRTHPVQELLRVLACTNDFVDVINVYDGPQCKGNCVEYDAETNVKEANMRMVFTHGCPSG